METTVVVELLVGLALLQGGNRSSWPNFLPNAKNATSCDGDDGRLAMTSRFRCPDRVS